MSRINIIFSGDRDYDDKMMVRTTIVGLKHRYRDRLVIVHGAAPGLDTLVQHECERAGVKTDPHPADWNRYGNSAGPRRNSEMLLVKPEPILCVGFHNDIYSKTPRGNPRGTHNMLTQAEAAGVPTYLVARWPIPRVKS